MTTKLALHTWTLDSTPLADALGIAKATGWDGVELRRIDFRRAEESGRPGTLRSKVGCEAIDDPWTKRTVPRLGPLDACFCQRNSLTSPFFVQCSLPETALRAPKAA